MQKIALSNFIAASAMLTLTAVAPILAQGSASPPSPLQMVEVDMGGGKSGTVSSRTASWFLGKNLALVVVMKARGAEEESYADNIFRSQAIASALGVELPGMPEIAEIKDIWTGRDYLVKQGGKSVRDAILAKHSEECAALFSLASESVLGGLLYSVEVEGNDPDDVQRRINADIVANLKIGVIRSKFRAEKEAVTAVVQVVKWIEDLKPEGTDFAKEFIGMSRSLEGLLMAESDLPAGSGPTVTPAKDGPALATAKTAESEEAEKLLGNFFAPDADLRALTGKLMPTAAAAEKLLTPELARRAAKVYAKLFADPSMVIAPRPGQAEVVLKWVTTDELKEGSVKAREFPGGYRRIAEQLQPGYTIYQLSFVEPGKESGMRFDGLVKIDGSWYIFPKLWNLQSEQPFGLEIE